MCGIAALFASKAHDLSLIHRMTAIIRHRGPDDEGYVFFQKDNADSFIFGGCDTPKNVYGAPQSYCPNKSIDSFNRQPCIAALGHRRLSIVDLSQAGHQPMCTNDSMIWITYNGEVYNYLEIRSELEALGHKFQTQTDTEVILQAYKQWGKDCLHRFNGMFAFVLFDRRTKMVFAARDRFGVKPLYYWISPQGLVAFASEIKQFNTLPGWNAKMNGQRVYDFLNWGVLDHTHETLFAGVKQLRGGEYLEFFLDAKITLHPKKWYHLKERFFQGGMQEASEQFLYLLQDSVKLRLRADVDVGSCLSGGIDSSAIVCLANHFLKDKQAQGKQKTFSACSEIQRYDERPYIEMIVNKTGVEAHYTYPSLDGLFDECDKIIWHQDEPFVSTSIYAQWQIFKLVKEKNVKVMLDGQGADEQLAGYHGFFGNLFYDLFRTLQWKSLITEIQHAKQRHQHVQPLFLLMNKLIPDFIRQPLRKVLGKSAANPNWLDTNMLNAERKDPFRDSQNKTLTHQSIQQILHSSLPMLLHFEDRDSMAHSVESRTPFLDYRLVEFTLGLPNKHKLSEGWTKRVLREGMTEILPEPIRNRTDKIAFATAEEDWIRVQQPKLFCNALEEACDHSQGILKPEINQWAREMIQGNKPFNYQLWRCISFGQWIKRFSVTR